MRCTMRTVWSLSAVKTHWDFFPDKEKMNKTKDLNDKLNDDIKKKVKKIVDALENVSISMNS